MSEHFIDGPPLDDRGQRLASEMLTLAAGARGRTFTRRARLSGRTGVSHECWTNAWELALSRRDLDYCEGIAVFADGTTHTHAWCIDRKGRVLEPTPGYSGVYYQGFVLPRGFVARATAQWKGWRSSILEALASAGFTSGHEPSQAKFIKLTGVSFERSAEEAFETLKKIAPDGFPARR